MTYTLRKWIKKSYLLPLFLVLIYNLIQSLSFPLHDFSNSFFAAKLSSEQTEITQTIFDIYSFNSFAWELGYPEVLMDFYLNSPYSVFAFYPFTFFDNPYTAKFVFNVIGCCIFIYSIILLNQWNNKKNHLFIFLLPIIFFVPIRNQILFGQSYFLVFGLIVFFIYLMKKGKEHLGLTALSLATLLKIFPIFYGAILVLNKKWKTIIWGIGITLFFIILSIPVTGIELWTTYVFKIIPNAIANNSTVNFQFNAQSIEVFLKTTFIQDDYYNPEALFNSRIIYDLIKWITKSVIIGVAIAISINLKKEHLQLLSIWVIAVLLLQSRTATYAQILWVIPALSFYQLPTSPLLKVIFFIILSVICNLPLSILEPLPLFFKFSRLWLSIVLSIILFRELYKYYGTSSYVKSILVTLILLSPLPISSLFNSNSPVGEYVLKHNYFMIFDFKEENGNLQYFALGKKGLEQVQTPIRIQSFDSLACEINSNQLFYNNKQITFNSALKKKPVLINNSEIYYLSDFNSRRGAYTLKKIHIKSP